MTITALPTPPARSQAPATFITNADAFMAALPQFVTDANALAASMNAAAAGGAMAIPYTFSTTTTDSDPGAGILRLDNATQNIATTIRADLLGSDGSTQTTVIDTFDDSTSTVKGYIRLVKASDATKFLIFSVSALASPSGYRNITVANVASSAASPFTNGDALVMHFTRTGDQGSVGATGGIYNIAAGGTVNAITATFSPAVSALTDTLVVAVVSAGANTSTTPTFSPNGLTAHTITARGGLALVPGDTGPANYVMLLEYNLANTRWELLNPAKGAGILTVTNIVSNTTLTAANLAYHTVAMTVIGQSVTFPDATTLTVGTPKAVFKNTGGYPFGLRDNTGALLMSVAPGGVCYVSLDSAGTTAGSWSFTGTNLEPGLITVDSTFSSTYAKTVFPVFAALDSNVSIHFAALSSGFAAFVSDNVGKVLSTPVTVHATASSAPVACFRIDATHAIVFYGEDASNHRANVLTLTGSSGSYSLSLGTAALASISMPALWGGEDFRGAPKIAQLSSSLYMVAYTPGSTTSTTVFAISVSGTVVTFGSAANIITSPASVSGSCVPYTLTATTALVIYTSGAATPFAINAVVISISGTTCTVGSPVAAAAQFAPSGQPISCLLSATKALIISDNNSSTLVQAIAITISAGTTVAAGAGLAVETGIAGIGQRQNYAADSATRYTPHLSPLTSSTALLWYLDTNGVSRAVVLSESGGTVTAGAISYRSISQAASGSAAYGYMLPPGTGEFCVLWETLASTAGFGFQLGVNKINGTAITSGTRKALTNLGGINISATTATSGVKLTSGDYVLGHAGVNNTASGVSVFRTNGDAINYRGEISMPAAQFAAGFPMQAAASNRVVLPMTYRMGSTVDSVATDQLRVFNVEIAA